MILRNISGSIQPFGGYQPDLQEPEQHEIFMVAPGGTIEIPDEVRTHPIIRRVIADGKFVVDSYDADFDSFVTQEEVSDLFNASSPGLSYIFRPGAVGPLNRGIYNDWDELYADYSGEETTATIFIDDSIISPAVIPAGTYTFREGTILGAPGFRETAVEVELSDGVVFSTFPHATNIINFVSVSDSPIYTVDTDSPVATTILERGATLRADGTAPWMRIEAPGIAFFILRNGGTFATGSAPVVDIVGAGGPFAALSCVISTQGTVQNDTIDGDALAFTFFQIATTSFELNRDQPGLTNAPTFDNQVKVLHKQTGILTSGPVDTLPGELVRLDPSGGAFTVRLPLAAASIPGSQVILKNVTSSTNTITIDPFLASGDLIDGAGSDAMTSGFQSKTYITDSVSNWFIV